MRSLAPLLALAVSACAIGHPNPAPFDRYGGPGNSEPCPGARWTSPVATYDLAQGPHVLEAMVAAEPGERLVAVTHRTGFSPAPVEAVLESLDGGRWTAVPSPTCWSSDTGNNGELGEEARDCVGAKQVRLGFVVPQGSARRLRLVLHARGPGRATGRARLQVVPATCRGLDACWRGSGNNCDGAPLSNCVEDEAGMLSCPTSVGSQAHDSCCSRWGERAWVCGACGSALESRGSAVGCAVTSPPPGLESRLTSPASGGFPGGYVPCRAEWDMAFRDVAALRLWSFPFDPLDITWRPTEITRLVSVRGKPAAVPLEGVYRFPAGATLRRVDAELGWCASGRWTPLAGGEARCD